MSIIDSIRREIPPLHPQGRPFVIAFFVVAIVLFWAWTPLGYLGLLATLWCAYFFRDPERVTPLDKGVVVAPADGRVSAITRASAPPELGLGGGPRLRLSIFMSVFDCHVNRSPVDGEVKRVAYHAGAFLSADLEKASDDNERNGLVIATPRGEFGVVQIAGLVARRIVCFTREGAKLDVGDRIGIIRFGSRVDVYMPDGARALVALNSRTIAGETVVADFGAAAELRQFRAS